MDIDAASQDMTERVWIVGMETETGTKTETAMNSGDVDDDAIRI